MINDDKVFKRKLNLIEYTIRDLGYNLTEVEAIYDAAVAGIDVWSDKELVAYIEDRIDLEVR